MSEDDDLASTIFGWVGTALATYFYIAPIVPFLKVIKGEMRWQDSPGVLLICSFLNCILWSDYGLLEDKFSVYFANGLGGTITLIYISIFLIHLADRKVLLSCVKRVISIIPITVPKVDISIILDVILQINSFIFPLNSSSKLK